MRSKDTAHQRLAKASTISVQEIALPKGGGAIKGIGEIFQSDEFTGTSSLSIPIPVSACRDFEPSLSVQYNSGNGNGIFGLGFDLHVPTISRKTSKAVPRYDESDRFILSAAGDLVRVNERQSSSYRITTYQPRLEREFSRIEYWINANDDGFESFWKVVDKENVTSIFGANKKSRVCDPENEQKIFQWLLEESYDEKGNHILYEYKPENATGTEGIGSERSRSHTAGKLIHRIRYGNARPFDQNRNTDDNLWHFEIVFDYGEYCGEDGKLSPSYEGKEVWLKRRDSFSSYHAGFEIRTHRLCRNILMFHRFTEEAGFSIDGYPILVHATRFTYHETEAISFLSSVESVGFRRGENGYNVKSMPPVNFGYTSFRPYDRPWKALCGSNGGQLPGLDNGAEFRLVDLYGEGTPGILYSDGATTLYRKPEAEVSATGVSYAPAEPLGDIATEVQAFGLNPLLTDVTGDGRLDLLVSLPNRAGFYPIGKDRDCKSFRFFESFPSDFHNSLHYMVDVTGDGLPDILLLDDERVLFHPSLGAAGYGAPHFQDHANTLPTPRAESGLEVWRFADMFGSGKQHFTHIANGKVEVWPNLGNGKFGRPVLFDNPPRFEGEMDESRLYLADLDGSGTADIIYLHPDRIDIYFNLSGNSFSPATSISLPYGWNWLNRIDFADVNGTGTSCMIFTENSSVPSHWCYDFCGGQKPYLLDAVDNTLGAKTKIHYASSSRFYLEDKKNGRPWIGGLPFPVHVVEKVETHDEISDTKLVSSFSYHHGYYDGDEAEFRGFGRVERRDAETLGEQSGDLDIPSTITKTWYHTGMYCPGPSLTAQFAKEYFQGDTQRYAMPDTVFELAVGECNPGPDTEAHRALSGVVLRQEIFAPEAPLTCPEQDSSSPYSAIESGYCVRQIQEKGNTACGVYITHARETISYAYERNAADPSVSHNFVVRVDAFGNALSECSVVYGRRSGDIPEQRAIHITADVAIVYNNCKEAGPHLIGIPIESRRYEISNLPPGDSGYLTFQTVRAHLQGGEDLEPSPHARLIGAQRHYYWNAEQQDSHPLGEVNSPVILSRTETLAYRKGELNEIFQGALNPASLESNFLNTGGYRTETDTGCLWNPGITALYEGREHFFLPSETIDPSGNVTSYHSDPYDLFITEIKDAAGNQTAIQAIDYQTLAPRKIRDMNGNISEVCFDPLGMVIVFSEYKPAGSGCAGEGFQPLDSYEEIASASLEEIIRNPQRFIQGARGYFHYDLFSWRDRVPVHAVSLLAQRYPSPIREGTDLIQIDISYSDGLGRSAQITSKVEDGQAVVFEPDGIEPTLAHSDCRWLTSGRITYNNKGLPIRTYEPFYINTWKYVDNPALAKFGVAPSFRYDALGRQVRMDTPKGFFTKVAFTPWQTSSWDENDTVKESKFYQDNISSRDEALKWECDALLKARKFYDTPNRKTLDNLGRVIRDTQTLETGRRLTEIYTWDIAGNLLSRCDSRLSITDPEVKNFRMVYAIGGALLKTESADAGTRWQLHNAVGNRIYVRDSRGFETHTSFDTLQRLVETRVQGGDGETSMDQIVERLVYGDDPDPSINNREELNLRGKLHLHYDQSGLTRYTGFTLQGRPREVILRLLENYKAEPDWNTLDDNRFSEGTYRVGYEYDAMGRLIKETTPDGKTVAQQYHISGRLAGIEFDGIHCVEQISYNAHSQREAVGYGNGCLTRYAYEPETHRLKSLTTTRGEDLQTFQQMTYTYDPVGNLTHIADRAGTVVFNGSQRVDPTSDYTYDATYRLIEACGREHPACSGSNHRHDPQSGWLQAVAPISAAIEDLQALRRYKRHFKYDDSGNIVEIRHSASASQDSWTKEVTVAETSNRAIESVQVSAGTSVDSFFDHNGNQIKMQGLRKIAWNHRNNIGHVILIDRAENPDSEYYMYGGAGSRTRKVTERYQNGEKTLDVEEAIYLGDFEIRRSKKNGVVVREIHTTRIRDGETVVAIAAECKIGLRPGEKAAQIRYQLSNHLKSVSLEVDECARLITYEEYYPYGGTSFFAGRSSREVCQKQYRYSGKERDASTGFYYYGFRYFAPWIGRWINPDPAGTIDGINLYLFVGGNPASYLDRMGLCKDKNKKFSRPEKVRMRDLYKEKPEYISDDADKHVGMSVHSKPIKKGKIAPASMALNITYKIGDRGYILGMSFTDRSNGSRTLYNDFLVSGERYSDIGNFYDRLPNNDKKKEFARVARQTIKQVVDVSIGKEIATTILNPIEMEKAVHLGGLIAISEECRSSMSVPVAITGLTLLKHDSSIKFTSVFGEGGAVIFAGTRGANTGREAEVTYHDDGLLPSEMMKADSVLKTQYSTSTKLAKAASPVGYFLQKFMPTSDRLLSLADRQAIYKKYLK